MKLIYPGPFDAVETENGLIVQRDEPTDVPDDLAAQLLEQGWVEADIRKPLKADTKEKS